MISHYVIIVGHNHRWRFSFPCGSGNFIISVLTLGVLGSSLEVYCEQCVMNITRHLYNCVKVSCERVNQGNGKKRFDAKKQVFDATQLISTLIGSSLLRWDIFTHRKNVFIQFLATSVFILFLSYKNRVIGGVSRKFVFGSYCNYVQVIVIHRSKVI